MPDESETLAKLEKISTQITKNTAARNKLIIRAKSEGYGWLKIAKATGLSPSGVKWIITKGVQSKHSDSNKP